MSLALLAALAAALCSGIAAVLQARAVGRPAIADRLGPSLVLRLARSLTYLGGLALVAAGFVLSLLALRDLPVFVVAVARACSLGVTAVLAWPLLGVRIGRREILALVALAAGLLLVVAASDTGTVAAVPPSRHWALLAVLATLVTVALAVERWTGGRAGAARAGVALAAVAGLSFGLVGVAARVATGAGLLHAIGDPAFWALAGAAPLGLFVYAVALQRTSVTSATATVVGVETLSGAAAGALLLGDAARPGWELAGGLGFAVALGGALALAGSRATAVTAQPTAAG